MNSNELASLRAQLEALQAENNRLKAKPVRGLSLRVSEKGGLSIYGMGRFPITLYKEQWIKLLSMAEEIKSFINDNNAALKSKADNQAQVQG